MTPLPNELKHLVARALSIAHGPRAVSCLAGASKVFNNICEKLLYEEIIIGDRQQLLADTLIAVPCHITTISRVVILPSTGPAYANEELLVLLGESTLHAFHSLIMVPSEGWARSSGTSLRHLTLAEDSHYSLALLSSLTCLQSFCVEGRMAPSAWTISPAPSIRRLTMARVPAADMFSLLDYLKGSLESITIRYLCTLFDFFPGSSQHRINRRWHILFLGYYRKSYGATSHFDEVFSPSQAFIFTI